MRGRGCFPGADQMLLPAPERLLSSRPGAGAGSGIDVTAGAAAARVTSVVIAAHTLRRSADLACAVALALGQGPDPHEVVVVVDNNPDLHEWVCRQLPGVITVDHRGRRERWLILHKRGRGPRSGAVLVFHGRRRCGPAWLAAGFRRPADRLDVIGVGGDVEPVWPRSGTRMDAGGVFVGRGCFLSRACRRSPCWSGTCGREHGRCAVRFLGGRRFPEDFGKTDHVSSPEDTDFCIRLAGALDGGIWWYEPSARSGTKYPRLAVPCGSFCGAVAMKARGKAELSVTLGAGDALRDERRHAVKTLPEGMRRELRAALADREYAAARRASAIGLGLGAASVGYLTRRARELPRSPGRPCLGRVAERLANASGFPNSRAGGTGLAKSLLEN